MNRANAADVQYGTPTAKKGSQAAELPGKILFDSALTCWLHSSATTRHALAPR